MSPQEFQQRFLPLARTLHRTAFALLGNAEDAEDAVQETYLRLWQQADRVATMEGAEGFFLTTLRHECLDRLRRRAARHEVDGEGLPPEAKAEPYAPPPEPEEEPDAAARQLSLLEQLPPNTRRLLQLRHVAGASYAEIAAITGLTEVNIRVILSRTRKQLSELYNKTKSHDT